MLDPAKLLEVESVELGLVIASILSIRPSNEIGLSRASDFGNGFRADVGEMSSMATLMLELSPNDTGEGLKSEISTLTVGSNPGVGDGCGVEGILCTSFLPGL